MTTVSFRLETLSCPSCVQKIEQTLSKQPGVQETVVRFHSSKVKAIYDEQITSAGELEQIILQLGYPVLSKTTAKHPL